jgi:hypothetical protein
VHSLVHDFGNEGAHTGCHWRRPGSHPQLKDGDAAVEARKADVN